MFSLTGLSLHCCLCTWLELAIPITCFLDCFNINNNLRMFLLSRGIEHQTSVPHTPQQNDWAEHFNCTILEKAETMHQTACLPPSFWQDVVETALHIYNRQPMCHLDNHLLYLNGMVRHLMCHILRFLDVWHMYSYPKRIIKTSYWLRLKEQPLLVIRKVSKDTNSGCLSTDE